ncbi:MAG: hemerythrin domain-containing protein, partial [Frankiaceae bacterium]
LERHHSAEDEDLWPVLRRHLVMSEEQQVIDRMVGEHEALSSAIAAVGRRGLDGRRQCGRRRRRTRPIPATPRGTAGRPEAVRPPRRRDCAGRPSGARASSTACAQRARVGFAAGSCSGA